MVRRVIGFEMQAENKRRGVTFYSIFLDCGHVISETLLSIQGSPKDQIKVCDQCGDL